MPCPFTYFLLPWNCEVFCDQNLSCERLLSLHFRAEPCCKEIKFIPCEGLVKKLGDVSQQFWKDPSHEVFSRIAEEPPFNFFESKDYAVIKEDCCFIFRVSSIYLIPDRNVQWILNEGPFWCGQELTDITVSVSLNVISKRLFISYTRAYFWIRAIERSFRCVS